MPGAECHIEFISTNRKECKIGGGLRSTGSFRKGQDWSTSRNGKIVL